MPDRSLLATKQGGWASAWLAAARSLEVRWVAVVAVVVPALLAMGVYWLRHAPASIYSKAQDSVIEVRLLSPRERVDRPQEPGSGTAPVILAEPPVDPPEPPIVETVTTLTPQTLAAEFPPSTAESSVASQTRMLASHGRAALAFRKTLLAHIARFRRYPEEARRAGLKGTVQVVFAMRRDGMVTDVQIGASSGKSDLDAAAAETIRRAQPLPRIPRELPERLTIHAPIDFDML